MKIQITSCIPMQRLSHGMELMAGTFQQLNTLYQHQNIKTTLEGHSHNAINYWISFNRNSSWLRS